MKPAYLSRTIGANTLGFALLCLCPWYRRIVAENPIAAMGIAHGANIILRMVTTKRVVIH